MKGCPGSITVRIIILQGRIEGRVMMVDMILFVKDGGRGEEGEGERLVGFKGSALSTS